MRSPLPHDILSLLGDMLPPEGGLIAMLRAYMDRGAKRDAADEVMCVACVIFKPTAYKQFVRPWNRMLKAWGAKEFHATDFYPGAKEFKRNTPERQALFEKDSRLIPQMIAKAVTQILIVSFRPSELMAVAPARWKEKVGTNAHSHAAQICLLSNGDWLKETKRRHESFAYFMESGDEDQAEVLSDVEGMRAHKNTAKHIKVASFSTVNKGMARGLEAADCVAWHWNKYYMDSDRAAKKRRPRKDFLSLVDATRGRWKYIFATGDDLKYIFSLFAPVLEM
jgi:hypothetical protein